MIISKIGRKHWRTRLLLGSLLGLLCLGAISMVYPFLLMISGSTKSEVDRNTFDVIPAFLRNETVLYQKFVEGLFNERLLAMQICYDEDTPSFAQVQPPEWDDSSQVQVDSWNQFLKENGGGDADDFDLGFMETPASKTESLMSRRFKRQLLARFDGDLAEANRSLGTAWPSWSGFYLLARNNLQRMEVMMAPEFARSRNAFALEQAAGWRNYFNVEGFFRRQFLAAKSADEAEAVGALTLRPPKQEGPARQAWEEFVRRSLNLRWLRIDPSATPAFQTYLSAKYAADINTLNQRYGASYARFAAIELPSRVPSQGVLESDWTAFASGWVDPDTGRLHQARLDNLRLETMAARYQQWRGDQVSRPPQKITHYAHFLAHRGEIRREFMFRNYLAVFDYILLHGRGLLNTFIYCSLAVLLALIVNPLAAYALSRYKMPNAYQLILFMLLTMAFPPIVTQIPLFLMLRDLNLLNTFAALLLPTMANGYMIFLLKGFFDSLPRELYESAQLDGAGEWTMFWRITMNLSRPILAVVALQAFTLAYTNFMFALLFCQSEKMWTLMVWLYQLQQSRGTPVMYAALLIAAVPTFLIFAFCQRIIMRGIVVPVEK